MDPISAFGLAVNVLTVVDLGIKVAAAYRSGGALDAPKLQEYSTGLENLSSKLISNNQSLHSTASQSTEKSLQECAQKALTASKALQNELAKSQAGASRFRKFAKSIKNTFSHKIEDLERELRNIQADLDTRLLVRLREETNFGVAEQSKQYKSLDSSIQLLFKEFCLSHTRVVDLIRSDNESTRAVIINELRSWKTEADRKDIEDRKKRLLESLVHGSPFTRENDIHEEHDGTFEWILEDKTVSNKSVAFSTWLREGNGIFWIQGKPGSGKSSLMKYIRKSNGVSKLLESWAAPKKPQMIKFFFWLADTTGIQNSLKGFLCSLLYQILKTNWALDDTYLADHQLCEKKTALNWDLAELKKILLTAVEEAAKTTPLFFLIDGLDECKEDDLDGVTDLILAIASKPNMKLCISSRPETKIRNTFRDVQFLKVQEYTGKDIRKYVQDTLGKTRDTHITGEDWDYLIETIVRHSDGVFLWSILVAKDVTKGVTNGDPVDQLTRRVQKLPKDMSKLYEEMLKRVGPDWELYKCEASSYFNLLGGHGHTNYLFAPLATEEIEYDYYPFEHPYLGEFAFLYEKFHGLRLAKKHQLRQRILAIS
ncbi:hypothetical protein H072_4976 [Dactylellina haptotyla CBS 200.50]|uniref:Nephrocystin 3-like N-terminal domain-containing protein n=1 Tax=Dactylellina haptotyla (strain CBS 200.50) TaxID=1284197 RepID=S8ADR1_DACHA|nr:hypothetical protein H072_4976 [Dactylellina haptotyla CBS 200.50]